MKRSLAMFSAAMLCATAPIAEAASITYTYDDFLEHPDILHDFYAGLVQAPFDSFNQSLGTLTGITFDYNYDATLNIATLHNTYCGIYGCGNGRAEYYVDATYLISTNTYSSGYQDLPFTYTAYDVVGPVLTTTYLTATASFHPSITVSGPDLATYLNNPNLLDAFDVDVTPNISDLGDFASASGTQYDSMSVTYTYIPAVPEPASWILMLGGIGMIGWIMRRRLAAGVGSLVDAPKSL